MFLYEKKIGYLSFFEDGEKKSPAGFVKILRERNASRLEIHIKKCAEVYDGIYALNLVLKNGEMPWGTVIIRKEEGFVEKLLPMQRDMFCLGEQNIREEDVCGILIKLREGRWISGCWKERDGSCEIRRDLSKDSIYEKKPDKQKAPEKVSVSERAETAGNRFAERQSIHAAGIPSYEDKWTRLQRSYKQVHPFGDERMFISVELRDFHLLRAPYQRLANNSFLLHGFYNYRHLILGPERELGESNGFCFYLGVPGTYFEREKMVAVMFGFEGFECSGAVETGKFGYYMRRVEIE